MLSPLNWYKPVTHDNYGEWREYLKLKLLKKRHFRSDWSGKKITESTGAHMHEGIVTRANVPRNVEWFWMIFDERNSLLLLPEEHIPQPPPREWCTERLYKLYGREIVRHWFYNLPWKTVPFELP